MRCREMLVGALLCMTFLGACTTKEPEGISQNKRMRDTKRAADILTISLTQADAQMGFRSQILSEADWPISLPEFLTSAGLPSGLSGVISSQCEVPSPHFYITITNVLIVGQKESAYLLSVFQTEDGARTSRKLSQEPFLVVPTGITLRSPSREM